MIYKKEYITKKDKVSAGGNASTLRTLEESSIVKSNNTGIPTAMKERAEAASGLSFDDVRVHYNSDKPSQLNALAYTQGNQVYIAPGQEQHLGHELGHVVQQKQGLVLPTHTYKGIHINDDRSLEKAADHFPDNVSQNVTQPYSEPRSIQCRKIVTQMRWKTNDVDRTAYWEGRGKADMSSFPVGYKLIDAPQPLPLPPDRRGGSGGFVQPGGNRRMMVIGDQPLLGVSGFTYFKPKINPTSDISSFFGGDLRVFHQGGIEQQSFGAPFPLPAPDPASAPIHTSGTHFQWTQTAFPPQAEMRCPERKIMGRSAREALDAARITPFPYAPWAHMQPDHTHPVDRKDPMMRIPTTMQANQTHSALESAAKMMQRDIGDFTVTRDLHDPISSTGLFASMTQTFRLPLSESRELLLSTDVPNFTLKGARSGDGKAVAEYAQIKWEEANRSRMDIDENE